MKTNTNRRLAAYMIYQPDEGVDFARFVERGAWLLTPEETAGLERDQTSKLREKIACLRNDHPRLARQLEFLESLPGSDHVHLPDQVRNETVFALLYAVKEMDLIPDHLPGVGYQDDTAIVNAVLTRHQECFQRVCATNALEWAGLQPEGSS